MYRKMIGLAAASAGALLLAAAAAAVGSQTLTGESFVPGDGTTVNTCSSDGGSAAFDFAGLSTGPYPGTYGAHVAIRYSPAVDGISTLSGAETFTVSSGSTYLSGTKDLVGTVECVGGAFSMELSGTYVASITTSGVTFNDHGTTSSVVQTPVALSESFISDVTQPVATPPTDTRHCDKGGWKAYGLFKNQGDCTSDAATKGKNQPGG